MTFQLQPFRALLAVILIFSNSIAFAGGRDGASTEPTPPRSRSSKSPALRVVNRETLKNGYAGLRQELWTTSSISSRSSSSLSLESSASTKRALPEGVENPPQAVVSVGGPSQTVTVEILAVENTCNGDPVPATIKYIRGDEPPVSLFEGAHLQPGATYSFPLPAGNSQPLQFVVDFEAVGGLYGCERHTRSSNDDHQTVVFNSGANAFDLIAAKNITPIFAGQNPLTNILQPYIDTGTGILKTPSNQSIIAFEAMENTANYHHTFDLNDVVAMFTTTDDIVTDEIAHDGIGPDTSATDGMLGLPSTELPNHSSYSFPASEFIAPVNGTLSQFEVVGYPYGSNVDWNRWDYVVRVWRTWADVAASRLLGNVANYYFTEPSLREEFGTAPSVANGTKTYRLLFDLADQQIALNANAMYIISISVIPIDGTPGASGYFRPSNTRMPGPQAKIVTQAGIFPPGISTSTLAYRITETPQIGQGMASMVGGSSKEGSAK